MLVSSFHEKYKIQKRKLKLSETDKLSLIKDQNNLSSLSNAPIFLGDDIEVDHIQPISKGGLDTIENMGIAHKDENRTKGAG